MLPVIALVGRPNVGKSTLFNRLTRTRDALVADRPGLTRDRQYGFGRHGLRSYAVIDTGGLVSETGGIINLMAAQTHRALLEADAAVLLVEARSGVHPGDQSIAQDLRRRGKPVWLVVNKCEGLAPAMAVAEFFAMGLGEPYALSASHGDGVGAFIEALLASLPASEYTERVPSDHGVAVAVIGRPNVGKSTLINRLLGEERLVTFNEPGTTRDAVSVPFERDGRRYTLIDTAGLRRRARVREAVEKFSIVKTLKAIDRAQVVVLVFDAQEGITEQDASLGGLALERGRAVVMAVNKWDGLEQGQRDTARRQLDLKLTFLRFAELHFISALHGSGVGNLLASIDAAYAAAGRELSTSALSRVLGEALERHPPPRVRGRLLRLRYAHQGGRFPPLIIVHGSRTASVPETYRRYLVNTFRRSFALQGTPVRVVFRTGKNPYAPRAPSR